MNFFKNFFKKKEEDIFIDKEVDVGVTIVTLNTTENKKIKVSIRGYIEDRYDLGPKVITANQHAVEWCRRLLTSKYPFTHNVVKNNQVVEVSKHTIVGCKIGPTKPYTTKYKQLVVKE